MANVALKSMMELTDDWLTRSSSVRTCFDFCSWGQFVCFANFNWIFLFLAVAAENAKKVSLLEMEHVAEVN